MTLNVNQIFRITLGSTITLSFTKAKEIQAQNRI